MTNTFSSVREALLSGILECSDDEAPFPPPPSRGRRGNRRTSRPSAAASSLTRSLVAAPGHPDEPSLAAEARLASISNSVGETESQGSSQDSGEASREGGNGGGGGGWGRDLLLRAEVRLSSSPPPPREIDLSELSSEDLERLRIEDPFLYYSIPAVRARSYRFEALGEPGAASRGAEGLGTSAAAEMVETSMGSPARDAVQDEQDGVPPTSVLRRGRARPSSRLRASCPAGMLADAELARAGVVSKRRRLSVEAHPALIFENFDFNLSEEDVSSEDMDAIEEGEDEVDLVLRALRLNAGMDGDESAEGGAYDDED
ncbi:hypothetical protein ACHAWF_014747 [Thalassiosira exigua]